MSSLPDDGAAAGGGLDSALMMDFLAAIFISIYLNSCFLVAEAIFIAHGPQGHLRHMIDSMAHILSGPIAFIAFFNGGFLGTFLFFCSIWHFLCDTGAARPSYVFLSPCSRRSDCETRFVWFTSLWLLIHHTFIGVFKLSIDMGIVDPTDSGCASCIPADHLIRSWMAGATMSHLSMGMAHFRFRGAGVVRLFSIFLRVGVGEIGIIITQPGTLLRLAMMWDLFWMSVMIALAVRPRPRPHEAADANKEGSATEAAEEGAEEAFGELGANASVADRVRLSIAHDARRHTILSSISEQARSANAGGMPPANGGDAPAPSSAHTMTETFVPPRSGLQAKRGGFGALLRSIGRAGQVGDAERSDLEVQLVMATHQSEWLNSRPRKTTEGAGSAILAGREAATGQQVYSERI